MGDTEKGRFSIDKIIHERVRLLILTYLASAKEKHIPFNEIKNSLDVTAGNLSIQLKNLEEVGYVKIQKKIKGRKPLTLVSLTHEGLTALENYINEMEEIIAAIKGKQK
ncbi:MAG: transcriptional regulator [Firmicutes bacterium]|nr:transcriptional regulator [Bacillota bacterium]